METFEIRGSDGEIYEIKAPSMEAAWNTYRRFSNATDDVPKPPPGVIIHDKDRSYVVGDKGAPFVSTKGMDDAQRDLAARALYKRNTMPMQELGKVVAPITAGVSSSFGDEAISAGYAAKRSLMDGEKFSDAYNLMQEVQRQDLEQRREEAPITSAVSQVGGAVLQAPLFAGPLVSAAGLPLGGRMAMGALVGGGTGAVEGFGSGSGLDDRLQKAGIGAGIGVGVGAAVPVLAQGAGSLYRKAADYFTVNKELGNVGLSRPAGDALMRVLDADNAFSPAGANRIMQAGDDAMLVDAGKSVRGVLDTAIQRGGPATKLATEAIEARSLNANRALNETLDRFLGPPEGVFNTVTGIREGTKVPRGSAYDKAYAAPIDYSTPLGLRLEKLITERVRPQAIKIANNLMRDRGKISQQILADIAENGHVTYRTLPDVRQIDYITRGINELAKQTRQGTLGSVSDEAKGLMDLSREIREITKYLVPEYRAALNTAANAIQRKEAVELGNKALSRSMARDEFAALVKRMTPPEKEALKQGIRSQIDEDLANVSALASNPDIEIRQVAAAMKQLTSNASFDKLATLLGPKEARELFRELGKSFRAAQLHAATVRNSATFGRGAVSDAIKQTQAPGMVGNLVDMAPIKAIRSGAQFMTGRTPQDMLAKEDEIYRQLSQALTGPRGSDALIALQRLKAAYEKAPANEELGRLLGAYLGTGTGLAAHQSARQYLEAPKSR